MIWVILTFLTGLIGAYCATQQNEQIGFQAELHETRDQIPQKELLKPDEGRH